MHNLKGLGVPEMQAKGTIRATGNSTGGNITMGAGDTFAWVDAAGSAHAFRMSEKLTTRVHNNCSKNRSARALPSMAAWQERLSNAEPIARTDSRSSRYSEMLIPSERKNVLRRV